MVYPIQLNKDTEIIQSWWYNPSTIATVPFSSSYPSIGIIKLITCGIIKYYIGYGEGKNEKEDALSIFHLGAPFYPQIFKEFLLSEGEQNVRST